LKRADSEARVKVLSCPSCKELTAIIPAGIILIRTVGIICGTVIPAALDVIVVALPHVCGTSTISVNALPCEEVGFRSPFFAPGKAVWTHISRHSLASIDVADGVGRCIVIDVSIPLDSYHHGKEGQTPNPNLHLAIPATKC